MKQCEQVWTARTVALKFGAWARAGGVWLAQRSTPQDEPDEYDCGIPEHYSPEWRALRKWLRQNADIFDMETPPS